MDPTAPKDNNSNQGTKPPSPSPIEPGQFVVAPPVSPDTSVGGSAPDTTLPPPPQPEPSQEIPLQSPQPTPLASDTEPVPAPEPEPLFAQNQPNPTPFVAPTSSPETAQAQADQPLSKIQRARKILIIVGIFLLVAILGAIVWLFIVGRSREQPAKTQSQEVSPGQEPSQPPIPKRTAGGFADLPAATRESQATASASPKTQ